MHVAALESFLATQDARRSTFVVWVPPPHGAPRPLAALARLFPGRLRFRSLDVAVEAEGTPLQRSMLLRLRDSKAWADSDIARLVVLYRYGGVYFDADVLLTRDLAPLLGLEFATEFSCDHAQGAFNNAVVRAFARSAAMAAMLERAQAVWPRVRSWAYGPTLIRDTVALYPQAASFARAPWCFFHGIWCRGAVPPAAMSGGAPWERAQLEDAAFGLHLHNNGRGGAVANSSVLSVFERKHAARVAELFRAAGGAEAPMREWLRVRPTLTRA
jgi:hypothetical protein